MHSSGSPPPPPALWACQSAKLRPSGLGDCPTGEAAFTLPEADREDIANRVVAKLQATRGPVEDWLPPDVGPFRGFFHYVDGGQRPFGPIHNSLYAFLELMFKHRTRRYVSLDVACNITGNKPTSIKNLIIEANRIFELMKYPGFIGQRSTEEGRGVWWIDQEFAGNSSRGTKSQS